MTLPDKDNIICELHTVRDYLRYGITLFNGSGIFFGHGTDNAWDEALAIILFVLKLPADSSSEILDARLLQLEKQSILALFEKRIHDRIPVPYLTGTAWFCGLRFHVDSRVLIPRSPVAEMISNRFKPWYQGEYPFSILDLCCGSGCIGIACAYAFEDAEILLSDISDDALDVAEENILYHHLENRASIVQSDLFTNIDGLFDIIVCNPPYVDAYDFNSMPDEYRHEPEMALASGKHGLDHPLAVLREAANYLVEDGMLVLEVGNSGQQLEEAYPGIDFNWVEFERGGHGVLVMSRAELENYSDQLSLEPIPEEEQQDNGDF